MSYTMAMYTIDHHIHTYYTDITVGEYYSQIFIIIMWAEQVCAYDNIIWRNCRPFTLYIIISVYLHI